MARQRYRSKLEVFRDVLVATRHASKKTRIMGLANLNPTTFHKHMDFAIDQGLIVINGGEYHLTDKADRVLAALQELMAKSNELDRAIQSLERSAVPKNRNQWSEGAVLRNVSRIAWGEVHQSGSVGPSAFSKSGGLSRAPGGAHREPRTITEILSAIPLASPPTLTSSRPVRRGGPASTRPDREPSSQDISSS